MIVVRRESDLRAALAAERGDRSVGFVPTMGALHEGHLSLIAAAREATDVVVVSIFVNPLQFGPDEDFTRYPRDEARDLDLAERKGADIAFLPSLNEMYQDGATTSVSVGELATIVEGVSRPGHFDGVATVVAKLFNLVVPDVAFFGQKDAQQAAVVEKMARELSFPIEIEVCPTVREPDGLALSSRNAYLTPEERVSALSLWRALQRGRQTFEETRDPERTEKAMWGVLAETVGVVPDYAYAVDPVSFRPAAPGGRMLLVVAARVGKTRLIDNLSLDGGG